MKNEKWAVITWQKSGIYLVNDVIKWYKSQKAAEKYADKEYNKDNRSNLVARPMSMITE